MTRIWTQGRPHRNEYVMEYSISYGTNGLDYADYKEPGGNTMVSTLFCSEKPKCYSDDSDNFPFSKYSVHIYVTLCNIL